MINLSIETRLELESPANIPPPVSGYLSSYNLVRLSWFNQLEQTALGLEASASNIACSHDKQLHTLLSLMAQQRIGLRPYFGTLVIHAFIINS